MVYFDTRTFLAISGRGGTPLEAVGSAFGMPQCLLNLASNAINLIPSSVLVPLKRSTQEGADAADRAIKSYLTDLKFLDGIIEYDSNNGTFRLVSRSSRNGVESDNSNSIGGFLGALGSAAGTVGRLYNISQNVANEIRDIKRCLEQYSDILKYTGGNAAQERRRMTAEQYRDIILKRFNIHSKDIQAAVDFRNRALGLVREIDRILDARAEDPSLEPEFITEVSGILSGTDFRIQRPPVPELPEPEELIRLSFGPPVSRSGKFVFSVDGLYFDSQTSGVEPVLIELQRREDLIERNSAWKLDFDPNIGGRGKQISLNDIKTYVNTILDDNIIDESNELIPYYEKDELLTHIIGQKNRRIFDVSSQIVEIQNEAGPEIIIQNLRQVLLSEGSHYQQKINKRKKQIELAVRLPLLYGRGTVLFRPGEVPVNDFSYLEGINFDVEIQQQRKLVLSQADVSGVVLPLTVNYVQQVEDNDKISIDHLEINDYATGGIVSNGTNTDAPSVSLNNSIATNDLFVLYNLLRFTVVDPSSIEFKLKNSSLVRDVSINELLNAQIVGRSEAEIFGKGVGIAYLEGITRNSMTSPTVPSSVGSYIRLPNRTELKDLFTRRSGGTFEMWTYAPELDGEHYGFGDGYEVSGLYRLLLANENTGLVGASSVDSNILEIRRSNNPNIVKGLIFGFTRDRRLTSNLPPSNNSHDNRIEDACLVLAPTQSFDSSSVGFVNKSFDMNDSCTQISSLWYNMKFNIWDSVNGVSLSSCGREFCQIALTLDPNGDKISMYCDGQLLTVSSYTDVFGVDIRKENLYTQSIAKSNSFEYNLTTMSSVPVDELKGGPLLDSYTPEIETTPWIIGGGYTDGMQTGNFMGGQYGGITSGFRGYVGGIKFYSRPLSAAEILNNYNASKNFFKNIDVPNLMWEPILSE